MARLQGIKDPLNNAKLRAQELLRFCPNAEVRGRSVLVVSTRCFALCEPSWLLCPGHASRLLPSRLAAALAGYRTRCARQRRAPLLPALCHAVAAGGDCPCCLRPAFTLQVVELDAGHCPHDEVPEVVNSHIVSFIRGAVVASLERGGGASGNDGGGSDGAGVAAAGAAAAAR